MKILSEPSFIIIEVKSKEEYIFYNSNNHFASRISYMTLIILNLLYEYKKKELIFEKINREHIPLVKKEIKNIEESGILSLSKESKNKTISYRDIIPDQYYLHLTYKCNLGCSYCYNKDVRKKNTKQPLSLSEWKLIIDKIVPHAKLIVLTGGEPFLREDISDIVDYIKSCNKTCFVEIISNCMHNFRSGLFRELFSSIDGITFSCDSLSENGNSERKNFDSSLFTNNIEYLRRSHPKLKIGISSTFIKGSEEELNNISLFSRKHLCRSKCVLVIPNNENEKHLLPTLNNYEKRLSLDTTRLKLNAEKIFCGAGFGVCSIDPYGNVFPCQNLHYSDFLLGNILHCSISDIFSCPSVHNLREGLSVENIETCKECNLKYICAGGCRAATYRLEGDSCAYPKTLCSYYKIDSLNKLNRIP